LGFIFIFFGSAVARFIFFPLGSGGTFISRRIVSSNLFEGGWLFFINGELRLRQVSC
jgi:hypothetical protein